MSKETLQLYAKATTNKSNFLQIRMFYSSRPQQKIKDKEKIERYLEITRELQNLSILR